MTSTTTIRETWGGGPNEQLNDNLRSRTREAWIRTNAYLQHDADEIDEIDPERLPKTLRTIEDYVQFDSDRESDSVSMANGMLRSPMESGRPLQKDTEKMDSSAIHSGHWDYPWYPPDTPAPAARQWSGTFTVMPRETRPSAEASNPWRVGLKSTISEDLSRQDDDQASKLQYLQKRLDRLTLKSLYVQGPHDNDSTNHAKANREDHNLLRSKDHSFGRHKEAK